MSKLILPTKHQFQTTHAYLYYLLESSILEKEGLHFTQLFNCSSEETNQFSSFQSLSCIQLFVTHGLRSTLDFPVLYYLPELS